MINNNLISLSFLHTILWWT